MLETSLRTLAEHPRRHVIVTIVIVLIGVVFGWPAVDNYFAAAAQRADFEGQLEVGAELPARLELYRQQLEAKEAQLHLAESASMSEANAQELRTRLVQLVREAGCTLRRIRLSDATQRDWYENDNPLAATARGEADKKTPFKLRTRTLSLTAGGELVGVTKLLAALSNDESLVKVARLALRRAAETDGMVELELDLQLFELVREAKG